MSTLELPSSARPGTSLALAERELLVLRDEASKNRTEISRLRHEAQVMSAKSQALAAANAEHVTSLESEMTQALREMRRLEEEKSGPTVPREALDNAQIILDLRREELESVRRDIETLEFVIRSHVNDPSLDLMRVLNETHPQLASVMGLSATQ
jgi:predicted  nucleic acid-binding Zn-ribbon protein